MNYVGKLAAKGQAKSSSKKRPRRRISTQKRLSKWLGIIGYFPAYIGLLLVISGGVYLPSVLSTQRADAELHQTGAPAVGEIVEIKRASTPHARPGGGSTTYYPMTEQTIRGKQTSKNWTSYETTNPDRWVKGEALPLMYDTKKPKRMVIDTAEASQIIAKSVKSNQRQLLIGIPLAAAGVAMIFVGRRIDPDPRKKQKRAQARERKFSPIVNPRWRKQRP